MADKRKLQGEMDRCFKKILEGVDTFEDIWQKLYNANNTNQKDKYESDLKKEIKKLQRLRDQIKTWAASNEVKDKRPLLEHRKLIETQMERFKVVERETKTKAYSKEGLGLATKIDPAQKERDETMQWLQVTIDAINRQVDCFESEIESVNSHSRKKKLDRDKQERIDELKSLLGKHRSHIKNLETLMRMLHNQSILPDKINVIRDDIEYYLEACQDPDYEDNEFMYEDMGLDESLTGSMATSAASPSDKQLNSSFSNNSSKDDDESFMKLGEHSISPNSMNHSFLPSAKEEEARKRNKSDDIISPRKPTNTNSQRQPTSRSLSFPAPTPNPVISNKQSAKSVHAVHNQPYAAAAGGMQSVIVNHASSSTTIVKSDEPVRSPSPSKTSQPSRVNDTSLSWLTSNHVSSPAEFNNADVRNAINSIVSSVASLSVTANGNSTTATTTTTTSVSAVLPDPTTEVSAPTSSVAVTSTSNALDSNSLSHTIHNGQMPLLDSLTSLKSMAEQVVVNAGLEQQIETSVVFSHNSSESLNPVTVQTRPDLASLVTQQSTSSQKISSGVGEARIQPLLGVAPLGPTSLNKEQMYQQAMLEACWRHMPHPSDSERLRHYLPRNPCPTPSYYHQTSLPQHDSLEFYLRLSTETLFFIFYYMEATKAQYMAAKALKKQSWRFHTKYMMWFQRHEEPKTITDEYEQGTYIYFDYEKWGQRKKEGFTFEYRYLEDRELQ
ncbi:CCR4-NOT transcription complex subunit 3-like [Clavelina lepadiformis]|uniref:CCR4-NOT transcription complex subunit 3-like n=1 Tax=Clavelina lepadiformis TaxID=159417 RepID=UPI004041F75F